MGQWLNKIGVEIESGVKPGAPSRIEIDDRTVFRSTSDGSLRSNMPNTSLVEWVSEPMEYPDDLPLLEEAINLLYGEHIKEMNGTMGLHVHFSLNKIGWQHRLCSKKFCDHLYDKIEDSTLYKNQYRLRDRMNEIFPRTNFARKVTSEKDVDDILHPARNGTSRRYWGVNYDALRQHQTIEVRVFSSMQTANQVMQSIELVANAVNSYMYNKEYCDDFKTETRITPPEKKTITL